MHGRHMHACALTQTMPWCFPLSPFSHSRFTGLQKGSLHFGPHDTQERRIVSHRLSYHVCPICPCGAPSPRGEGYDTRIPSSKKTARHPCEPIRSPASSSRAQPRDLSCAAVSIPHVLAGKRRLAAAFSHLKHTSLIGLQGRFLDFARNDDTRVSLSAPPT